MPLPSGRTSAVMRAVLPTKGDDHPVDVGVVAARPAGQNSTGRLRPLLQRDVVQLRPVADVGLDHAAKHRRAARRRPPWNGTRPGKRRRARGPRSPAYAGKNPASGDAQKIERSGSVTVVSGGIRRSRRR